MPECYPGGTETRRLSRQANRTDHNNRTYRILSSRIQRTRLGILCRNETLVRLVRLEKVKEVRAEEWDASTFNTNHHYYFPVPYQQVDLAGWTNNAGY